MTDTNSYAPGDVLPDGSIMSTDGMPRAFGAVWVTKTEAEKAVHHGWRKTGDQRITGKGVAIVKVERRI